MEVINDRNKHLINALKQATNPGYVLEFGVFSGDSINVVSRETTDTVYGFDSFEGLPEVWERGGDGNIRKAGEFAVAKAPEVRDNVELVVGWFSDTLKPWMFGHPGPVRFIHIDADLYTSTKYVLKTLNDRIEPGTIIVFDELVDWKEQGEYPAWKNGEWKAWNEWMEEYGRESEMFSRTGQFQAAVRVVQ